MVKEGRETVGEKRDREARAYFESLPEEHRIAVQLRRLAHGAREDGAAERAAKLDAAADELHPLPEGRGLGPDEVHLLDPFLKKKGVGP